MAVTERVACKDVKPVGIHGFQALHVVGKLFLRNHTVVEHGHQTLVSIFLRQRLVRIAHTGIIRFLAELDALP